MRILAVDPASPLYGHVRSGYELVAVNGEEVLDRLDLQFKLADEMIRIRFDNGRGRRIEFELDNLGPGELGLTFEDERLRRCKCNCVFCFVNQQPKGMRRALYVRDEDYRLSFTHGNYLTLSNVSDADFERIIGQRLSPLYISVHATDNPLRRRLLGNPRLKPILPQLERLIEGGILIHTQAVVCPGLNDGEVLRRTIEDLGALHPGVQSLAVVPVGLTRYREKLPPLRTPTPQEASVVIDEVHRFQRRFLQSFGSRVVWAADEFYLRAGRELPGIGRYEEMAQWENGVGMLRYAITAFNRRKRWLKGLKSPRRVVWLTGLSAHQTMEKTVGRFVQEETGLDLHIQPVSNDFWGDSVTVSGLLTGHDLLKTAEYWVDAADVVVLPPNCLNDDALFLDDLSLAEFKARLDVAVVVGSYDWADTIREAFA